MTDRTPNLTDWRFIAKKNIRRLLPTPLLNLYFSFYPCVGNLIFGRPSQKIKLVGLTGTDGKSSSVMFAAKILQEAGYKVGFFSSVAYSNGAQEQPNTLKMTMPGRFFLQRFLKKLVDNKCDIGIVEVTSEGIKQKRNLCINFDVALITNLKPEHIESHRGFKNYKQAKSMLFKNLSKGRRKNIPKSIIVNTDDAASQDFLNYDADKKITFGTNANADVRGVIIKSDLFENILDITIAKETTRIHMHAGGPFIAENALAAIAVAHNFGVDVDRCRRTLEKISNPPGRFEIVSKSPFVIVDYAHTTAAVEKLLSFVRENWPGNIVHVFGAAGGGRDRWKRPQLAALSEKFANTSILTEENSFDEKTELILEEIRAGFTHKEQVLVIPRRAEALKRAVEIARNTPDTLLLLTAKGSETVIAGPRGHKIPYNEKETVLCILNKK